MLLVGGALTAVYVPLSVLPSGGAIQDAVYLVLALGCATFACVTAARRRDRRVAWWLMAAGLSASALGDVLWTIHEIHEGSDPPFPWIADGPYLLGWLAVIVGVSVLVRDPDRSRRLAAWLDAGVLTLAGAVVLWLLVVADLVRDEELTGLTLGVALAYPLIDLALLGLLASLLLDRRRATPTLRLIALGAGAQLVADVSYAMGFGEYVSGGTPDLGWLLAYVLFAAAALHPSSQRAGTVGAAPEAVSHRRVLLLWFAVLSTTVVVTVAGYPSDGVSPRATYTHVTVGAGATVLMATLVLWRLSLVASHLTDALAERELLQLRLEQEANHDALTGLANRRSFSAAIAGAGGDAEAAVIFVDLDRFKDINDRLGHAAGDEVLQVVGARLAGALRPSDVAARIGGDEFAALLVDLDPAAVADVAARVLEVIRAPMMLSQGTELRVDASVGTARADLGDERGRDLLHDADVAMYEAKRSGRSRVTAYSPDVHAEVTDRLVVQADLRRAAERSQFALVYQPIVAVADRRPVGVEALLRWHHPTRGAIPPAFFIPLAEASGDIIEIGRWVLDEACRTVLDAADGADPLQLNVNVSAVQLHDTGFAASVERILAETGFDPRALTLEITESVLVEDDPVVRATVERLRRQGIRFAVDDFGTGFSALRYLRDVPLDELKIDRSFVAGVDAGPEDAALAHAVLHLADSFGLATVGEGVETESQLAALGTRGCLLAQGYLFSPPLPIDDLLAWLAGAGEPRVDGAAGTPIAAPSPSA